MGTGRKMGASLQEGVRSSSLGTGQKMGTSLQKGIK